jgi:HAD superfamily hydrolase (TIGR01509 family)
MDMQEQKNHKLAIVFDFGNVLVDWDPRYLYRKLLDGDQAIEQFLGEVDFFEWNLEHDAGRPFDESIAEMCARFPQYCDLIRAYDQRYEESISGPIWPTVEVLRLLKDAGYPLYALSNWPSDKFDLVRPKYEFFSWFDDIVISGKVRIAKPDPRIFELLLERIGRPAGECLFIDDSPRNIAVAERLGFQTIRYDSTGQLKTDLAKYLSPDTTLQN